MKYKHCCLNRSSQEKTSYKREIPPPVQKLFDHWGRQRKHRLKYGEGTNVVSGKFNDSRVVAVGPNIYQSSNWKTFHDFLDEYWKRRVGLEWGVKGQKLPFEDRHPLLQWHLHSREYTQEIHDANPGVIGYPATGPLIAALSFAYDLYIADHHMLLDDRLLSRIKHIDQFQGARYELLVIATFIRAGFTIELENENDPTCTHCEFVARHKTTGQSFSVEAKSRHRDGFLGKKGKPMTLDEIEADAYRLLQKALMKDAAHERVIFVDVNVPPRKTAHPMGVHWLERVAKQVNDIESRQLENSPWPPAYLFFTNCPYHYVAPDEVDPGRDFLLTGLNIPAFKKNDPKVLDKHPGIKAVYNSLYRYQKIPHEFD